MAICLFSHADIDLVLCVGVLCCSKVVTAMSAVVMGTAGLPSGSIPLRSLEAAARVKTTSAAQGVYKGLNCYANSCVFFFLCLCWCLSLRCSSRTLEQRQSQI